MLIFSIIAAILVYPLWMWIHEISHIRMADKLIGVTDVEMKLYPHMYGGSFWWAFVFYRLQRAPRKQEQFLISLAPRIPDLIACALAPLAFLFGIYPLGILLAGGIIDLFVGSLGRSPLSDLQKAASTGYMSEWELRGPGLVLACCFTILCIIAIVIGA